MAAKPLRFAWAVVRELLLGVGAWIGVCATLSFWYVAIPVDPVEAILGSNASPGQAERVRRELGLAGSVTDRFFGTFFDLVTFQFGNSYVMSPGTTVWELAWAPFWRTVVLAVVTVVVAGFLAAVPLLVTWYVRASPARYVFAVPAYVLGSVPAFAWTVVLVTFSAQGPLPFTPLWRGDADPLGAPLQLLLPAFALSIPLASFAVRRVALTGPGGPFSLVSTNDGDATGAGRGRPYRIRSLAVESWTTLAYAVGALATVELVFAYRGIASLWYRSLVQGDLPTTLGTTALVAAVLVVLGVGRNVAFAVGEILGSTPSHLADGPTPVPDGGRSPDDAGDGNSGDGDAGSDDSRTDEGGPNGSGGEDVPLGMPGDDGDDGSSDPDEGSADDGSAGPTTAGSGEDSTNLESGSGEDSTGPGSGPEGPPAGSGSESGERPSFATVLASARRFQVGLAAFALLFLVGTLGSLVLSPRPGYNPQQGLELGILVHALGSLTTSAVVAGVVAVPVGVLTGTLAGRYGRPTGTVLGFPKDVLAAFPMFVLAGLAAFFATAGGGRTLTELLVGAGAGLAILPGVFRATALEVDAVLSARGGERPGLAGTVTEALPDALAPSLGRSADYVGFALLVAAEVGFLGLGPVSTGVVSDVQAYVAVSPHLIVLAVLPVALPAAALWLMADGLRAAARPS